jgi:DNA processing protein
MTPNSPTERRDWIRLSRTENIGPITFRQLLRKFASPSEALRALPDLVLRGGRKKALQAPSAAQIEDEITALNKLGGHFLLSGDPNYPESLAAIEDAPPVLAVLGHDLLLNKRCVGIVGARNASMNGRKMAEILARDLGKQDIAVVSGLARGIDTAAHKASLATGTVAVLAGGVDVIYPEENRALYESLIAQGAIVSDQPMKMEPRAQLFPRRNRIISGLSLGVVVVEAARQSGSLITARLALEQGREVFAVPGSPLDPRAQGTNDLLREGATLTASADDIMRALYALPKHLAERPPLPFDGVKADFDPEILAESREKILMNLGPSPVQVDELIRECQLSPSLALTLLLELELAGRIERQPGNKVALLV